MADLPPKYAPTHDDAISLLLERLAQEWFGARSHPERVFYNETRAGLLNPNTLPEGARPLGGLGMTLGERRFFQGLRAQNIADDVRAKFPGGTY